MRGQPAGALDKVLSEDGLDAVADRLDQVAMSDSATARRQPDLAAEAVPITRAKPRRGPLTCGFTL